MTAWLHIVGVGEGGVGELPAATRLLVSFAEVVIGPPRFLADLEPIIASHSHPELSSPDEVRQRSLEAVARALLDDGDGPEEPVATDIGDHRVLIEWQPPLANMVEQVLRQRGKPTVVLASGDPMWFGIGASLARHLDAEEFVIHPLASSFQFAAARLHWPLQHVATISLHGRPPEGIHPFILPGHRVLALTSDAGTARHVADALVARGYGQSRMTVLENLGGQDERITETAAELFEADSIGDFYVLGIDCVADVSAPLLPPVPGLPDEAFVTDGQLTKREVRAATIARLAPYPGALLWDVGAGCGSIAIEWMRAARDAEAIAFEREGERLQMIAVNAAALGVPTLRIENGEAPGSLAGMPAPDAIFLGGNVADDALFQACWNALKPGGRLVANAVTLDAEAALYRRQAWLGGDLVRIDVATLDAIGTQHVLRPRLPVTQWAVVKPEQWLAAQP
ncbi:precorrin-6y C5,15-methyltransferase (decarboxylating) subunit CbiE [Devosia sp.]|uniref:precorrin-6y C5,15-methyltransferase (decarboxylating) subunit CbiE n=1 Tax=Devosia sp. TaxID=1871048 RepID=UPI002F0F6268